MARKRHSKLPGPKTEPSTRQRTVMAAELMKAQMGKEKPLSTKLENKLTRHMRRGASRTMRNFSGKMPMMKGGR